MGELSGRAAIITGSANNIGRSVAVQLARAGASIVVHAKSNQSGVDETCRLVREAGGTAMAHLADLTNEAEAEGLVKAAIDAFGRIDILVNNAALRRNTPYLEMSLDQWNEVLSTNLLPSFFMTRAALPSMIAQGWGRVVMVGGVAGHKGVIGRVHVATAKAGLVGFTKAVATEFADKGVTANIVVPGLVHTERGPAAGARPQFKDGLANLVGREGTSDEIAHVIAMLCMENAAFTTGQTMHVNGGAYLP